MHAKDTTQNRKPRGQSLVEFALLLPFLLVLIISALEFGRLFYTKIVITNAAREGANYYVANPSKYGDEATLRSQATLVASAEAQNSGIPDITVGFDNGDLPYPSIAVTVNTTVTDVYILGFVGNFLSITVNRGDFDLSSTIEMRIQWQ